jgi:hypothetical protein
VQEVQLTEPHVQRLEIAFSVDERRVIADALGKKEDGVLHFVSSAMTRVTSGQPITMTDAIVIHGALMVAHDIRATPIVMKLRVQIRARASVK